jgi:membrane protease subunit HflK
VVLKAKGEVAEFLAVLPEYTRSPQVTAERLYLETFQHVLTKSTKVIVDSKPGNVIYLPLDKLNLPLVNKVPPVPSLMETNNSPIVASAEQTLPLVRPTDRSTTRPTAREE